jgi:hypothetical protein
MGGAFLKADGIYYRKSGVRKIIILPSFGTNTMDEPPVCFTAKLIISSVTFLIPGLNLDNPL